MEDEDDDEEIDLNDINPEILKAAEEMGITPQELIRQLQKQLEEEGGEYGDEQEPDESDYSQGEIDTRNKLLRQKSPSAPYLLYSYREEEPLHEDEVDSEGNELVSERANSTTLFEQLKKQGVEIGEIGEGEDEEGEGDMDPKMMAQQMLLQQQQKQQQ